MAIDPDEVGARWSAFGLMVLRAAIARVGLRECQCAAADESIGLASGHCHSYVLDAWLADISAMVTVSNTRILSR